jgi:DNA-binding NtrC family response regulator
MGLRILVVEDSAEDRALLEQLLTQHGHSMCWASGVKGAEKLLLTERVELVILDYELANGETGDMVARSVPRGIPMFIRSGHSAAHIIREAARISHPFAGVSVILGKPDVDGLLREIRRLERVSYSSFPGIDTTKVGE